VLFRWGLQSKLNRSPPSDCCRITGYTEGSRSAALNFRVADYTPFELNDCGSKSALSVRDNEKQQAVLAARFRTVEFGIGRAA
jgi:hypothetical protein